LTSQEEWDPNSTKLEERESTVMDAQAIPCPYIHYIYSATSSLPPIPLEMAHQPHNTIIVSSTAYTSQVSSISPESLAATTCRIEFGQDRFGCTAVIV
jgi:hypothetical protein